jgi:hypothetical protein
MPKRIFGRMVANPRKRTKRRKVTGSSKNLRWVFNFFKDGTMAVNRLYKV